MQLTKSQATLDQAKKSRDIEKRLKNQREVINIFNDSSTCFTNLSKTYPEIDHSDTLKQEVVKRIENMCPNPMLAN